MYVKYQPVAQYQGRHTPKETWHNAGSVLHGMDSSSWTKGGRGVFIQQNQYCLLSGVLPASGHCQRTKLAGHGRCECFYLLRIIQSAQVVFGGCICTVNLNNIWSLFQSLLLSESCLEFHASLWHRDESVRAVNWWKFGKNQNVSSIRKDPDKFNLGKQNQYATESLCVMHLMTNVYNCMNEDMFSCYGKLDCPPPTLEQCLTMWPYCAKIG